MRPPAAPQALAVLVLSAALTVGCGAADGGESEAPPDVAATESGDSPEPQQTPDRPAPAAPPAPSEPPEPPEPPEPSGPITVALAGDVHGEPPIDDVLAGGGNPLDGVASVLAEADLSVVNLETAVGTTGAPESKQFTFQAPPALLDRLADADVDVVTVANNHALDYGVEGLLETIDLAEQAGVAVVGGGRDATEAYAAHHAEVGGRTVAVLGLTRVFPVVEWGADEQRPGLASAYDPGLADAVAAVEDAAASADHVVVAVHWGAEQAPCPNEPQLSIARALVDAGADVVAGHHPHVLQGVQEVDDAVIAYSLGNFVWYASGEASGSTGVLTVALRPDQPPTWQLEPARIDGSGSPRLLTGSDDDAERISGLVTDRSPGGGACDGVAWP